MGAAGAPVTALLGAMETPFPGGRHTFVPPVITVLFNDHDNHGNKRKLLIFRVTAPPFRKKAGTEQNQLRCQGFHVVIPSPPVTLRDVSSPPGWR